MSFLYLLLSSVCSLVLIHLLKAGETRNLRMLNVLTVNYLAAGIFAFSAGGLPPVQPDFSASAPLLLFSIVTGALFIANFVVYSKSIHLNGMGVSVAAMRLSLLVPVLVSIMLYQEVLSVTKFSGLLLVFAAMALLLPQKKNIRFKNINAAWLLLIIFLLAGFADASLKVYEEEFSLRINELGFMGLVFICAFLIGLILSIARKGPLITREEFFMGALIGIPNLYSSVFLIYALQGMDGAVAYPVVNILNVTGGVLLGLWWWSDRVSQWQWMGIGIAIAAIVLLV